MYHGLSLYVKIVFVRAKVVDLERIQWETLVGKQISICDQTNSNSWFKIYPSVKNVTDKLN